MIIFQLHKNLIGHNHQLITDYCIKPSQNHIFFKTWLIDDEKNKRVHKPKRDYKIKIVKKYLFIK